MEYPKEFSEPAIWVAETFLGNATHRKLTRVGNWDWAAEPYLLSNDDFESIKLRFLPYVKDRDVLRLIDIAFSKRRPDVHMRFVNDGYALALGQDDGMTTVVVHKTHECRPCYRYESQSMLREAAYDAVRALINWRLEKHSWQKHPPGSWPRDGQYGADLICDQMYLMIKNLADSPCCMKTTMRFVLSAVPDLREAWEDAGLSLVPVYHAERDDADQFITLRLTSKSPA